MLFHPEYRFLYFLSVNTGCMIRPALEKDLPEIASLWKDFMEEETYIDFDADAAAVREWTEYARKHLSENGYGLLVSQGQEIEGFVMFEPKKSPFRSRFRKGYISDIYVRPEKRRRGIAKSLMQEAMKIMGKEYDRIHLQVFANNEKAIKLYRSLGFDDFSLILDYKTKAGDR